MCIIIINPLYTNIINTFIAALKHENLIFNVLFDSALDSYRTPTKHEVKVLTSGSKAYQKLQGFM